MLQRIEPGPFSADRSRRPQRRALETRDKILPAAATEFARHGFKGASLRRIAQAAGVQYTLLTYHFQSKDNLWRETLAQAASGLNRMLASRIAGLRGVETATKLRLVLEEFIRFSAANPQFHWLMSHEAAQSGERLDWLMREHIGDQLTDVAGMILEVQAAGRFVAGDPMHLQYLFIGAVTHIFMLDAEVERVTGRSPFSPDFVDEHVRLVLSLFFREPA